MKEPRYLFPEDFMADPSANVFNGRLYIYPSHDFESGASEDDDGGHFQMRDYHAFTLDDIERDEARDLGTILDVSQVPWAEKQMWDNDVVEKNGKYYLVFSAKAYNGQFRLGVAVSDRPEGPFVPQEEPITKSFSIDPCVFRDDDGEVYCYFGGLWGGQLQRYDAAPQPIPEGQGADASGSLVEAGLAADGKTMLYLPKDAPALPSRVARMTGDVLQFAEDPRPVVILGSDGKPLPAGDPHRFFEASWMHKHDNRYYFSYSTGDSHLLCYAVGDNPYGPFTYQGVILEPVVGWTTHHSIVEYRGKWYLFHHDSAPSGGKTWLRSMKVKSISYDEEGHILSF